MDILEAYNTEIGYFSIGNDFSCQRNGSSFAYGTSLEDARRLCQERYKKQRLFELNKVERRRQSLLDSSMWLVDYKLPS